jgi:hypothetical protein
VTLTGNGAPAPTVNPPTAGGPGGAVGNPPGNKGASGNFGKITIVL